jgi:hypothetical protein
MAGKNPLDKRSRDLDGQIRRKRGDTQIGTLRDEYPGFAPGVRADMRLDTYLKQNSFDSLSNALGSDGQSMGPRNRAHPNDLREDDGKEKKRK